MSRARSPQGPAISLFPFLAVLLCTMGALLVLLVLFSRSAQQGDAAAAATRAAHARVEELLVAREELAWRRGHLESIHQRTAADLARARMQLAGIEEDARKLADEFDDLEQTAAALTAPAAEDATDDTAELERQLAAARASLEEARREAGDRPPAYAVVPYVGPAGTHRRPLYIECCIDGVFLQPEGIRLGPSDFEGPPGPGNPLASGLRAAREHLANRPGETGDPEAQPYPLLLVRPSGVMAYYAAREALQSWGSDFGYQFIDEEWTLAYPPADPALAEAEARAVDEARRRMAWLAQVRGPQRTKPVVQYRAATNRGGVVASGGPSVLGDQSRWDWTEEQVAANRGGGAAGRGFRADGDDASGGGGDALLGQGTADGGEGTDWSGTGGPAGSRYLGPSKFYGGSGGSTLADADATGVGSATDNDPGTGDGTPAGGETTSAGRGAATSGSTLVEHGAGDSSGSAVGGAPASGSQATAGSTGGTEGAAGRVGGGGFGPALPGLAGGAAAGTASPPEGCADGSCSLAGRRGSNWASLATRDRPIPLTRPIRLECDADEFRLLGDGGRVAARIPIGSSTAAAVDPLVREVHATVGGWGMAGDRMYWRPELVLSATPAGGSRRDDLERLLADSGLETRRADAGDAVRRLPPVHRTGGLPPTR